MFSLFLTYILFIAPISDVVLESGTVLESDTSPYFEDSDSNPLDSDLDSD